MSLAPSTPIGQWTVDDIPDDELFRYELVDGVPIVTPSPPPRHQYAALALRDLLAGAVGRRRVLIESDVVFDSRNLRRPDVVVLAEGVDHWRTERLSIGEAVLAVEVVSPSSVQNDEVFKRAQYANQGIPFYWVVRTEPEISVQALELPDGGEVYAEVGRWREGETAVIERPVGLSFDPAVLRD